MTRNTRIRIVWTGLTVLTYVMLAIQAHAQTVNEHAIVHNETSGQPVRTESTGTCVRTKWMDDRDPCGTGIAETTIQRQVQRTVISQDERTVYFPFNVAALSPDAMSRLDTLANDIKAQSDIKGASVVGFADRIGTPSYNEQLSKKRAEVVKNYLAAKGILGLDVGETKWFGASMPRTSCPADWPRERQIDCLQNDRRVEVEIKYASEVVASQ